MYINIFGLTKDIEFDLGFIEFKLKNPFDKRFINLMNKCVDMYFCGGYHTINRIKPSRTLEISDHFGVQFIKINNIVTSINVTYERNDIDDFTSGAIINFLTYLGKRSGKNMTIAIAFSNVVSSNDIQQMKYICEQLSETDILINNNFQNVDNW